MKVLGLYKAPLRTANVQETLADAAGTMTFHEVGALPVFDDGTIVGIITERDIVRAIAEEADVRTVTVGEYMTPGPIAVSPDTELDEARRLMSRHGARHLPVIDDHGRIVGMLSARDLLSEERA